MRPTLELLEARVVPANLVVMNLNSSGSGSLAAAVATANADADDDTITFASSLSGHTITATGSFYLSASATIIGPGPQSLAISGPSDPDSIFVIGSGMVSISGLTIENAGANLGANAPEQGAAINNEATLNLDNVSLVNNTASFSGAAIFSDGFLTLSNSTLSGNVAGAGAGAIYNGGYATILNCTFVNNTAHSFDGLGGKGGAITNGYQMTICDSTISGNTAQKSGGGIDNVYGSLTLRNTIIAGNSASNAPDVYGNVYIATDDLFGTSASSGYTITSSDATDIVNANPGLQSTLAYNGGTTKTLALLPTSPAIGNGAAPTSDSGILDYDQRGLSIASPPDIGAFQLPMAVTNVGGIPINATTLTINATGFDPNTAMDSITFDHSISGSVTGVSGSSVTIRITGLSALTPGTAVDVTSVTVDGFGNPGGSVEIGTIDTITAQPTDQSLASGSNAVFTASAEVSADTVQWDVSSDGGATFTPIPGATATTLTVSGVSNAQNNNEYEAIFADQYGTVTSEPAFVTLTESQATTTTLIDNGPNPSEIFGAVSFTINVASASPISGETVYLEDASNSNAIVATATLTNGTVTLPLSTLTGGSHSLFAVYIGDETNTHSRSSPQTQNVAANPVVMSNTSDLMATASILVIGGNGFDPVASKDKVSFDHGVSGSVMAASTTGLTVSLTGLSAVVGGTALDVVVTSDGYTSGNAVPVATVQPVVTTMTASLPVSATTLTITGYGFDSNTAEDSVSFSDGVSGITTGASSSSLTVSVTGLTLVTGGTALDANVTVDSISSGVMVPVAIAAPVVTLATTPISDQATTIIISGDGFATSTSEDTVLFSLGVVGTVSSATATQLTVTLTHAPTAIGSLSALVTTNSATSGTYTQVATLTATTWVVTDANGVWGSGDATDVTLPYAVARAVSGDVITFSSALTGDTISPTGGTDHTGMEFTHNATIVGLGEGKLFFTFTPNTYSFSLFLVDSGASVSLSGLTIENVTGTDILNYGTLSLSNDMFTNDTATSGGAVLNEEHGVLTANDCIFTGNVANGGVGGAIDNDEGTATILNSTISSNFAFFGGGGIASILGGLTVSDSTISGNEVYNLNNDSTRTQSSGGGMEIYGGSATLSNDTIAYNIAAGLGGGLYLNDAPDVTLLNTLVADNSALTGEDVAGTITLASDTLIGTTDDYTISSATTTDQLGVSVGIASTLAINGGSTPTLALTPGSNPAIGNGLVNTGLTTDQRGIAVAIPADIGAFQLETVTSNTEGVANTATILTITGSAFDITAGNDALTFNDGITGIVSSATNTTLTVEVTGLSSLANGTAVDVTAITVDGVNGLAVGSTVQVATVYTSLSVNSAATPTGVVLTFNLPIDPTSTVLYSTPGDTTLGAPDIVMTGSGGLQVRGSLLLDATNPYLATFVQTSGLLASGNYTVTVTTGVKSVGGLTLSENYSTTLSVIVPATTTPVLSVPSFARGPGQPVQITDSTQNDTGIPVSLAQATDVTLVSFTLTYDPSLLTIQSTNALNLSSAASTAGLSITGYSLQYLDAHHETLSVTISGGHGFNTQSAVPLLTILASVPTSAPYTSKSLLSFSNIVVNSLGGVGVSGVDVAAYLGDVTGEGTDNALGASLVDQVGSGAGTGFSEYKDLDPAIIGAVSGGVDVSALDASLIDEAGSGQSVAQIPTKPGGITLTFGGPDPYLYLSDLQDAPGQTATETLYLDVTAPNGIQLTALDEAIGFDTGELQVSNVRSTAGLAGLGSYAMASSVDDSTGVLLVGQAFMGSGLPPVLPYGTVLAVMQFDVTVSADATPGSIDGVTLLQNGTINGQTKFTAISDNEGALSWTPGRVPSNSGNAAIDGTVTVIAPSAQPTEATSIALSTSGESSAPQMPVVVAPVVVRRTKPETSVTSQPPVTSMVSSPVTTVISVPAAETSVIVSIVSLPAEIIAQADTPIATSTSVVASTAAIQSVPQAAAGALVTKASDSGASLSLVILGSNMPTPNTAVGTSGARASTAILDEVFRQGPVAASIGTGWTLAGSNDYNEEVYDPYYLDMLAADPAFDPTAGE